MCSVNITIVFRGHHRCVLWASLLCSMGIAIVFRGHRHCVPWTLPLCSVASPLCSVGIAIVFRGLPLCSVDITIVFRGHGHCVLWASLLCSVDMAVVLCGQKQKGTCYLADSFMTVCLAAIPFLLKISWFICDCLALKKLK